jgi:hypothetical protein
MMYEAERFGGVLKSTENNRETKLLLMDSAAYAAARSPKMNVPIDAERRPDRRMLERNLA